MKLHIIAFSFIFAATISAVAANDVVQITSKFCIPGTHKQPVGLFALFVFCNEYLGTDVAVYLHDIGNPIGGAYSRGRRFWQGEIWGWNVTSYSWIDENSLLISTSYGFGSGSVFLLNLEAQTFKEVLPRMDNSCMARLLTVNNRQITVEFTKCETQEKSIVEFAL